MVVVVVTHWIGCFKKVHTTVTWITGIIPTTTRTSTPKGIRGKIIIIIIVMVIVVLIVGSHHGE